MPYEGRREGAKAQGNHKSTPCMVLLAVDGSMSQFPRCATSKQLMTILILRESCRIGWPWGGIGRLPGQTESKRAQEQGSERGFGPEHLHYI